MREADEVEAGLPPTGRAQGPARDPGRWAGRWIATAAAFLAAAAAACNANATGAGSLPTFQIERMEEIGPPRFDITLFAPRSWTDRQVRSAMLEKAGSLAASGHATCFTIEQASLDRKALYIPLNNGHVTIRGSDSQTEWQRYWRLYQMSFRPPGLHIGLGRPIKIGEPIVQARLLIWLCPDDNPGGGLTFRTKALSPK